MTNEEAKDLAKAATEMDAPGIARRCEMIAARLLEQSARLGTENNGGARYNAAFVMQDEAMRTLAVAATYWRIAQESQ